MAPPMLSPSILQEKDPHGELLVQTLEQAADAVVVIDEHNRVVFLGIRIWLCLKAHSRPDSSSSISVFMSAP